MKCISILTDELFGIESKRFYKPTIRLGARGIVLRNDNKIAIIHKKKKNEYKLPGGGIEEPESSIEAFKREVLEETGCEIEIVAQLGNIKEYKSLDNFKQISNVYFSKVINDKSMLDLTEKEQNEGATLIWEEPKTALKLISSCLKNLKESSYENLYHSKFIVVRDKLILEYYLNNYKNDIV